MFLLNLNDVRRFSFPGGERQVVVDNPGRYNGLRANIRNANDLMDVVLTTDALKQGGCRLEQLVLPYLPYAQQDRYTEPGVALSARVFADIVNSLGYQEVVVFEPHSDVAPALIKNCRIKTFDEAAFSFVHFLAEVYGRKLLPVAPDAGAVKRVEKFIEYHERFNGTAIIDDYGVAIKHRDPKSGWIEIKQVTNNIDRQDCVVLDDLCIGGQTFIQLAKFIKNNGMSANMNLFTAHGIYSKGVAELFEEYQYIGTTDSWLVETEENKRVMVYNSI